MKKRYFVFLLFGIMNQIIYSQNLELPLVTSFEIESREIKNIILHNDKLYFNHKFDGDRLPSIYFINLAQGSIHNIPNTENMIRRDKKNDQLLIVKQIYDEEGKFSHDEYFWLNLDNFNQVLTNDRQEWTTHYYYQGDLTFISDLDDSGRYEERYNLYSYNLATQERQLLVDKPHGLLGLSQDKLLLFANSNRRGKFYVYDTNNFELLYEPTFETTGTPWFLTNNLFIHFYKQGGGSIYQLRITALDGSVVLDSDYYIDLQSTSKSLLHDGANTYFVLQKIQEPKTIVEVYDMTPLINQLRELGYAFTPTTGRSTVNRLRVRENPNLEAQTYGYLSAGDEVEVLDRSGIQVEIGDMKDYWYKIRNDEGLEGWAYGFFLELDEPEEDEE